MPWPINYSRRENCGYVMCEVDGHAVCWHFAQYYERLCAAAATVLDAPSPEALETLRAVLNEAQGAIHE